MSLYNPEEHRNCIYYATPDTALFKQYSLLGGENISGLNDNRNVLVYISTGSLDISLGGYPSRRVESETLVFLPKNMSFICHATDHCHAVASFFMGQVPLCSRYDLVDLEKDTLRLSNNTKILPPPINSDNLL